MRLLLLTLLIWFSRTGIYTLLKQSLLIMDKEEKRFVDHFSDKMPPHQITKHPNIQWYVE